MNTSKTLYLESILPLMATIWLFVVLDSYIVWNPLAPVVRIFPALFIIVGTLGMSNQLRINNSSLILGLLTALYFFWVILLLSDSIAPIIRRVLEIIPMLCILFWPKVLILKTYRIVRKVIIFFAIGSSIVSILILLGLGERLPHLVLPPREALHVRTGMVYYLYGLFIADCYATRGVNCRACGMLQEPGHFAIILGFIYIIERLCYNKNKFNFWIVLSGVLTFSSAFVLIAFFTEIHQLFEWKKLKKVLLTLPIIVIGLIAVYNHLPSDIKDEVEFLAYGRNLESVIEAYNDTSSLIGALDERANDDSIAEYENMSTLQYIVGKGPMDEDGMLSDYRGLIFMVGLIGAIMTIIIYVFILHKTPIKLKIALGFAFFLVFIHRSWMFISPYIFFLAFLAVFIYRVYNARGIPKAQRIE